jgi:hypothetical protein
MPFFRSAELYLETRDAGAGRAAGAATCGTTALGRATLAAGGDTGRATCTGAEGRTAGIGIGRENDGADGVENEGAEGESGRGTGVTGMGRGDVGSLGSIGPAEGA